MHILIELLHLVAAAALSLIGFGYERDEECHPVHFQPAAMVETVEQDSLPTGDAALRTIEDCEAVRRPVRLPAL